jgi:hypothetical protein
MEKVILIEDINNFVGRIPAEHDFVCYEKGTDPMDGYVLYGFVKLICPNTCNTTRDLVL